MASPWDFRIFCAIKHLVEIAGERQTAPSGGEPMRKLLTTMAATAALFAVGSIRADAMPLNDPAGVRTATDELNIIDTVQYYYGGRRFCWYDDGWNGPGYYWCGQYLAPGIGWGGGWGWRGWRW